MFTPNQSIIFVYFLFAFEVNENHSIWFIMWIDFFVVIYLLFCIWHHHSNKQRLLRGVNRIVTVAIGVASDLGENVLIACSLIKTKTKKSASSEFGLCRALPEGLLGFWPPVTGHLCACVLFVCQCDRLDTSSDRTETNCHSKHCLEVCLHCNNRISHSSYEAENRAPRIAQLEWISYANFMPYKNCVKMSSYGKLWC